METQSWSPRRQWEDTQGTESRWEAREGWEQLCCPLFHLSQRRAEGPHMCSLSVTGPFLPGPTQAY